MVLHKSGSQKNPPNITAERRRELQLFEKQNGLRFRRHDLLNLAFSHRSFANELDDTVDDNEKLEFLGDSVLGLVVTEYLYLSLPGSSEGDMAKIKSFVVSEASLAGVARKMRVENFILIGKGEEYSGGRSKKAILADCMEAIIGAYYLDSGFKAARSLVRRLIVPEIKMVLSDQHEKDYKTLLQELAQKMHKTYPRYAVVRKKGPNHDRTFWIQVEVNGRRFGPGSGKNKKEAEQNAARTAYQALIESSSRRSRR